jgi:hypothetical protein
VPDFFNGQVSIKSNASLIAGLKKG